MKRFLVLFGLLAISAGAMAQAIRYDIPPILNSRGQPIPNAQISLCTGTATINGTTCSVQATSFTDITMATGCAGGSPVTLPNSNVCQATGDSLGNAGFWLGPGAYIYCINAPSVTGKCLNLVLSGTAANVIHVGGSNTVDIGTQINTAYAGFNSAGGKVIVDPKPDGTCYSFTVPIVATTSGKLLLIESGAGSNTNLSATGPVCLNYTPTTATTAITVDYATPGAQNSTYVALRNILLINNQCITSGGCGSSATGVSFGTTNFGISGGKLENVSILGFGVGLADNNPNAPASNFMYDNLNLIENTTGETEGGAGHSSVMWNGGTLAGNGTGIKALCSTCTPELVMWGTTFFSQTGLDIDMTAVVAATGTAHLYAHGVHLERAIGFPSHSVNGAIDISYYSGVIEDDNTSGTTDWLINTGGNFLEIDGTVVTTSRTATTFVVANSPTRGHIKFFTPTTNFAAFVTGANAGKITQEPIIISTQAAKPWTYESVFQGPTGAVGAPTYSFSGATTSGLYMGSSNPRITSGGVDQVAFGAGTNGTQIPSNGSYNWAPTSTLDVAPDTVLSRSAAGVVAVGTAGGGNSGGVLKTTALLSGGAAATFTGSTGACSTTGTQSGGASAGRVTCTAATAASTLVIVPGFTAPNGWTCSAFDQTTRANLLQQTATGTTSCTLTATSITQNDVIVFQAIAF